MILYLPLVVFAIGLLVAYGSAGWRRQAATIILVLGAGWSLALLVDPAAMIWAAGPVVATLMMPRPAERMRSTFEGLTRRATTIGALMLLALVLAARLPFGENPLLLNVVPWFVGALGAAWVVSPSDARERVQGQTLMIGATGALLLAAVPGGVVTAGAAGASALTPVLAERGPLPASWRPLLSSLMLLAALVAAIVAGTGLPFRGTTLGDLSISFAGPTLVGVAVLFVAGATRARLGSEWAALLGVVALVAPAPSLRWATVAALVAAATAVDPAGERPAWLALAALAAVPFLQPLAPPIWSSRGQAVALAVGLVLIVYAARAGMLRSLVLPAAGVLVLLSVGSLSTGNLTRFQWITAAGALLLLIRAGILHIGRAASPSLILGDQFIAGLLVVGLAARDAPGLGALAALLLLIDYAIIRLDDPNAPARGFMAGAARWARSNWPGSVTFAGATLAVIAALQASLALGLLAALLLAGLQLAPLMDGAALVPAPERPRARVRWLEPLSIVLGAAPALLLRMLRL